MPINFKKQKEMQLEVIEKYSSLVPIEVVEIWKQDGIGSFLNGYLRVINPDDYCSLIKDTYFRGEDAIPLFVTAFGDVVTWERGEYVGIVKYKNGTFDIMIKNMKKFFRCLEDKYFINKFFSIHLYEEAVNLMGELSFDECYGYVTLLGLGGNEKVSNLKKVRTREHIEIITQLVGKIGM